MSELLFPLHSKWQKSEKQADRLSYEPSSKSVSRDFASPEDVLDVLQSEPDQRLLVAALNWLASGADGSEDFNIRKSSPKATQIIYVLINDIIPAYWDIVTKEPTSNAQNLIDLFSRCLSSVAGLGAVMARIRSLLGELDNPDTKRGVQQNDHGHPIEMLLNFLERLLWSDGFSLGVWRDIALKTKNTAQSTIQWKEFVPLLASGKLLSTVSEAEHALNSRSLELQIGSWLGDGTQYSAWLGKNVAVMVMGMQEDDTVGLKALSQFVSKAFTLGYPDNFVRGLSSNLEDPQAYYTQEHRKLMSTLSTHDQKSMLYSLIRICAKRYLSSDKDDNSKANGNPDSYYVNGVAAFVAALVEHDPHLKIHLVEWLTSVSAEAVNHNSATHRAVAAALSRDIMHVQSAFDMALQLFGDKLFIKHSPMLRQEVNTQILLLLTGYISRTNAAKLKTVSTSSTYLNGISNHLAASSSRAHFLGMVVGTAISEIVDAKNSKLSFSAEEIDSKEGLWYRSLTRVQDCIGSIQDIKSSQASLIKAPANQNPASMRISRAKPVGNATSKIISIEEVHDDLESEQDDLPVYEKPDSDPSDSDEDPTLVQRDKPTVPVYIRDLLKGLRDTEDYNRYTLALRQASSLIRRKASFGTEVLDNIEELATVLVGLSDRWELDDFQTLRLQSMLAVLVAEPLKMSRWFSRTFYNGEYSLSQRASILTTLGLGAREIAGLGTDDATLTGAATSTDAFPSKKLPDKLHKLYALEAAPMSALAAQLEKAMIKPLAAAAADRATGPNALKVHTFSSRMEVEKKRRKPVPNALAKIVSEGFFFPLTGRWRIQLQAYGENNVHTTPILLAHLLRTLSLILHASGTSNPSLPQMTSEFWDLLLSVRPRATELSVLEALLFSFLTLLDVNENNQRSIAEEQAKELLETQEWVADVFDRVGGGSEEGDRVRMLAAGVLVRTRGVVEKYQRLLMGDLVDFM